MRRRLVSALALLALAAGAASAASAASAAPSKPAARDTQPTAQPSANTVRLNMRLETTSDWAKVLLSPGRVEATRVISTTPGSAAYYGAAGWELRAQGANPAVLEVDAVFDDASAAASYAVQLQKGAVGTSKVTIRNTTGKPFTALTASNTTSSSTDPSNTRTFSVARDALMGSRTVAVPKADSRHLALAFYYPWFGGGYADPTMSDRPADGRLTTDPAAVRSMTDQARSAGIDGFIVSWSGNDRDGAEYDSALRAAEQTSGLVAPYLETTAAAQDARTAGKPTIEVVKSWLGQVLDRADSAAMLTSGGETVIFVWDARLLTPQEWASVIESARNINRPIRLVTDAFDPSYDAVSWGAHNYVVNDELTALTAKHRHLSLRAHAPAALDPAVRPRLYAATVSPGYDDTELRGTTNPVVPRGVNGERYAGSWKAATSSNPDWVLVNSWNEWFEGTPIEPSVEHGDLALRQTRDHAAAWHAAG